MAWSWSHLQQAYANSRENLSCLDKPTLEIIFAEWRAAQVKHGAIDSFSPHFSQRKYDRALKHAQTLSQDTLVDFNWKKASEQATCENGGHEAWMCPYGCGAHCVSFDRTDAEAVETPA